MKDSWRNRRAFIRSETVANMEVEYVLFRMSFTDRNQINIMELRN
jgi:hypothetical protein